MELVKYKPKTIVVIDQAETPLNNLKIEVVNLTKDQDFKAVVCDIRNKIQLNYLFNLYKPNIIYHCAACKHVSLMEENPFEAVSVNIEGTKTLSDLAVKFNVDRFIMVSTDKAVNPISVMGVTKYLAELYLRALQQRNLKTKFMITRFGNVLGSNGSVIPLFRKQIEERIPLTITHAEATRFFISVDEVCKLILESSHIGNGGELFIFDMGKPIKVVDLAKRLIASYGLLKNEIKIDYIGLRAGEKLHEELFCTDSKIINTTNPRVFKIYKKESSFNEVKPIVEEIIETSKNYNLLILIEKIKHLIPHYPV